MLELKKYTVTAEEKTILKNIDFVFETGKIYAIMGPNGSGKSTLALTLAGAKQFTASKLSKSMFGGSDISTLSPEKRARAGLFISLQAPPSITGVTVFQMLRTALAGKQSALEVRAEISKFAEKLSINPKLLKRSLNVDFSGGERKKMEVLQMAILNPKLAILDEIDTGVDVDALKIIATFLKENKKEDQTYIFITHNTRILEFLKPDAVLIMKNGEIAKTGDAKLAKEIEKKGYTSI